MPYFGTNVKEWQSGLGVDFLVLTRFENPAASDRCLFSSLMLYCETNDNQRYRIFYE